MCPTVTDPADAFLALLLDEPYLLDAEFDAIIAASWPSDGRPIEPGPGDRERSRPPERRGDVLPARWAPPARRRPQTHWRRERSPP